MKNNICDSIEQTMDFYNNINYLQTFFRSLYQSNRSSIKKSNMTNMHTNLFQLYNGTSQSKGDSS